jgi:anti-sigma factor ChrR (cupin superfamily)
VIQTFRAWPADVLRPSPALWDQLLARMTAVGDGGTEEQGTTAWKEPEWEEVASGISCKLLSNDPQRDRVSMLVRLAPGVEYPPHTHAGVEELYLLQGELWIGDRKLYPGDYNRAEPGTIDTRVWSEHGCACLLITSPSDRLA